MIIQPHEPDSVLECSNARSMGRAPVQWSEEAPFTYAAGGEDTLCPARAGDDGVDLCAAVHDHEPRRYRRATIGEVDGECTCAVGVHFVAARGRRVREIGNDLAVNRDCVDLGEAPLAVEFGHGDANLLAGRPHSAEFGALNREAIAAADKFVIAGLGVALRRSRGDSEAGENQQA